MLASRPRFALVLDTALPPSTVGVLPTNEIAMSGCDPREAPTPVFGCVRAAFDDEPIFFSVLDEGAPGAAARLETPRINAMVNPASGEARRRESLPW